MSKTTGVGYAATVLLVPAAVLFSGAATAMEIVQFDQMTNQDRQDFLDSLSKHAETVLEQEGRSADAEKVHHLFNDISPGSDLPLGEVELELNLGNARVTDAQRAILDPSLLRIKVEAALAVTLKRNDIELSADFLKGFAQLTGTFHPQHPSKNK
jgi:hypothetical protein